MALWHVFGLLCSPLALLSPTQSWLFVDGAAALISRRDTGGEHVWRYGKKASQLAAWAACRAFFGIADLPFLAVGLLSVITPHGLARMWNVHMHNLTSNQCVLERVWGGLSGRAGTRQRTAGHVTTGYGIRLWWFDVWVSLGLTIADLLLCPLALITLASVVRTVPFLHDLREIWQ